MPLALNVFSTLRVLRAGASALEDLATCVPRSAVALDARLGWLYAAESSLLVLDLATGERTVIGPRHFEPGLSEFGQPSPGPYPGSLLVHGGSDGSVTLVDVPTRTTWILAR